MFVQIRTIIDENVSTCIQVVSRLPVFEKIRTMMRMAEHLSRLWVTFEKIRTTDKKDWIHIQQVSSLKCMHRSEPLTRMAEHSSTGRLWVSLFSVWAAEPLTRINIQFVSHSQLEVYEQISTIYKNGWTCIQHVSSPSRFGVFRQIRTTDENCWTYIQQVSHSPVFELIRATDENVWNESRKWVSYADQCHCQEWLNTYTVIVAGCELISNFEQI